jgi:hypothetical protein
MGVRLSEAVEVGNFEKEPTLRGEVVPAALQVLATLPRTPFIERAIAGIGNGSGNQFIGSQEVG